MVVVVGGRAPFVGCWAIIATRPLEKRLFINIPCVYTRSKQKVYTTKLNKQQANSPHYFGDMLRHGIPSVSGCDKGVVAELSLELPA